MPFSLLEIFEPYIPFISFFITITLNIIILFKSNMTWYTPIILNVMISIIMNFIGLGSYDILTQIIEFIGQLVDIIMSSIF